MSNHLYSLKPCIEELERFYRFMNARFGLNLPDGAVITIQKHPAAGKRLQWECGCTRVRCAVEREAVCGTCRRKFKRA